MKKMILASCLMLAQFSYAQNISPSQLASYTQYMNSAKAISLQKIHDPAFAKPFFVHTQENLNYTAALNDASYFVSNAEFHLPLPVSASNLAGNTSSIVIQNNPFLQTAIAKLYKELPTPLYSANQNWLNMQNIYSLPTEYDYLPGYGHVLMLGFCENVACNNYMFLAYNLDNSDIFGSVKIYGYPPQVYLLNVDSLQKMAVILMAEAYKYVIGAQGTLYQWLAAHPSPIKP